MIRRLVAAAALVAGLLGLTAPATAANRYVHTTCTFNGTGTADDAGDDKCANSNGASGPYNSLQTALDATVAGDTLYLMDSGTNGYVATAGSRGVGTQYDSGFAVINSGTLGNLITITAYAGDSVTVRNCTSGSTTYAACARLTFSVFNQSYVRITGLTIVGSIGIHSDHGTFATLPRGNKVDHITCSGGFADNGGGAGPGDGNWSCLWTERQRDFVNEYSTYNHIAVTTGGNSQSSAAAVKVYSNFDSTFQFLTCNGLDVDESQSGCFDDKEATVRNTWQYLYCVNAGACFRNANQRGTVDTTGYTTTGLLVQHVVASRGTLNSPATTTRDCVRFESGGITDLIVRRITCDGFQEGFQELTPDVASDGIQIYSNIIASSLADNIVSFGDDSDITRMDFNCWDSDVDYHIDSNYSTLAALVAGTPFEDHGVETASSFGFTAGADTNYHLSGGSCAGHGSLNGTSVDSSDPGAYANGVTCVGATCGAGAAAPTVSSVTASSGTTAGGTSVTITGANFVATPTSVTFGGSAATSVSFTNSTTLTCTTPAHAAGAVDVVVTNPDAQNGTGTGVYTYVAPVAAIPMRLRRK